MIYPHRIRLRGPWELELLARYVAAGQGVAAAAEVAEGLPPATRVDVPGDWGRLLGAEFRGRVRYRRAFHAPPLSEGEAVWLVVDGVDALGSAALNGEPLGPIPGYAAPAQFDITQRVRPYNLLAIEVKMPPAADEQAGTLRPGRAGMPGGLIGEVRLEVRRAEPSLES